MTKVKFLLGFVTCLTLVFSALSSVPTSAKGSTPTDPCTAGVVTGVDCKQIPQNYASDKGKATDLVSDVIDWILIITGILAVIMIIISGMQIATSSGNAEKVNKAKQRLLWSVIGLLVALLASAIVNLVVSFSNDIQKDASTPQIKYKDVSKNSLLFS